MSIAGHVFDGMGRCQCGKHWTDIMSATDDDVGTLGIAHQGKLYLTELEEIKARAAAVRAAIDAAFGWRSAAAPEPEANTAEPDPA